MPPRTRASARLAETSTSSAPEAARSTRTSRAAGAATATTPNAPAEEATAAPVDPEVDADFLALSKRQQLAVDRAFDKAARRHSRKKRRGNDGKAIPVESSTAQDGDTGAGGFEAEEEEGGFMPAEDAGGFMADDDDDDGGGFLPPSDEEEGGFMADDDTGEDFTAKSSTKQIVSKAISREPEVNVDELSASIPLSSIPAILGSLNLPSDDDVLAVFRESASGWGGSTESTGKDSATLMVARTDFRAVCAALMPPHAGGEDAVISDGIDEEDDDDVYEEDEGSGASTPLSSAGGMSDVDMDVSEGPSKGRRGKGKAKKDLEAQMGVAPKITREQKEGVRQTWDMFLEISTQPQRGPRAIGKDEVRKWAKELGETYTEDEIADMINLFSTQPEKRALSYDDFSNVLVRGGLV